jgi:lipopolysaccharide transport system permease protein
MEQVLNPAIESTNQVMDAPVAATVAARSEALDDLPLTVIEPRPGWRWVNLAELWRYRELLYFLSWRDIKVRYRQTVLGAAWAVLQPLVTMLVFTLFLGRVAAKPPSASDVPYPLFVFAGILPWTLFAAAISAASQSVVGSQNLVTKVYFPRLLIPIGAVGACLVDFLVATGILFVMMAWYRVYPGWGVVLLPLLASGVVVASLGVGILLAALTVRYRDFRHIVPFMVQIWMFATPSIYLQAETTVRPAWQMLLPLNPAQGLIANFRLALLGGPLDIYSLVVSGTVSLLLLAFGCAYFRRVERAFADII